MAAAWIATSTVTQSRSPKSTGKPPILEQSLPAATAVLSRSTVMVTTRSTPAAILTALALVKPKRPRSITRLAMAKAEPIRPRSRLSSVVSTKPQLTLAPLGHNRASTVLWLHRWTSQDSSLIRIPPQATRCHSATVAHCHLEFRLIRSPALSAEPTTRTLRKAGHTPFRSPQRTSPVQRPLKPSSGPSPTLARTPPTTTFRQLKTDPS